MKVGRSFTILLAIAALVTPATLRAETVLGADGILYRAVAGRYHDLVPRGIEAEADAPVLVLEVERPGEPVERLLVPGTEGGEVESTPFLVVEPSSDTVHLVWGSTEQVLHSSILLVSRRNGQWGEVIEVSGRPFTIKTAPRLAVTHDSFPYSLDNVWGRQWMQKRTVLHTVWWEETGLGGLVMYSPLTLINGQYTGEHQVLELNQFDGSTSGTGGSVAADLLIAPSIGPGDDLHTVVVTFANPDTDRVVTLRVSALPYELTQLADSVRDFILAGDSGCDSEAERQDLAAGVTSHIKTVASHFNPVALDVMASSTFTFVLDPAGCSDGLEGLADAARMHIIGVGARASLSLTRQLDGKRRMHIIGVGVKSAVTTGEQHFTIRLTASFPLPLTGDGPTTLYASRDGTALLVAWQEGDRLIYRETSSGGWSTASALRIDSSLSLAEAHLVLRDRIANRGEVPDAP